MSETAERNKSVIRRLMAEVDRGNLDVVDECYASTYVDRTPTPIRGLAEGRNGVRTAFALFHRAFPDTRHVIEDLVAEDDRVVARISAIGTHTGELFGHAPTGKVVSLTGIAIYRLVEGRIVERWAAHGAGILDQLGIPVPESRGGGAGPPQREVSWGCAGRRGRGRGAGPTR
jgi:predicted ester cyclase